MLAIPKTIAERLSHIDNIPFIGKYIDKVATLIPEYDALKLGLSVEQNVEKGFEKLTGKSIDNIGDKIDKLIAGHTKSLDGSNSSYATAKQHQIRDGSTYTQSSAPPAYITNTGFSTPSFNSAQSASYLTDKSSISVI